MRKNLLALSIAAMVGGLSGVANAQAVGTDTTGGGRMISNKAAFGTLAAPAAGTAATVLNTTPSGVGHILVVPYFTTQGTNMTLLNLVNTDQVNGKAVKLRFRGAANSDDLFDITVYLSPGDVWAANVSADGAISALTTADNSCTLPSAAEMALNNNNRFKTERVLDNDPAQTREGYVEILNMADIPPNTAAIGAATIDRVNSALFTATKHVGGVAPCLQAVMDLQAQPLTAGGTNDPVVRGYSWPTGGLMANWTIVNVGTNASFSGEAVAIAANGAANLVFSPQNGLPLAAGVNPGTLTADPLLRTGLVRAANYDFPDLSTPYTTVGNPEAQANALGAALATRSISNEYLTNPAVAFATDWVFSMPTRRYALALDYASKSMVGHGDPLKAGSYGVAPHEVVLAAADFSQYFSAAQLRGNASLNKEKNRICIDAGALKAYNMEEQSQTTFVVSPGASLKFCGETSVLSFNGKPSVLGASIAAQNIPTGFTDGWMRIDTNGIGNGLPVVGYAVGKATGPNAGNFGGTWMHRTQ